MKPRDYFVNYNVYDTSENVIKFTKKNVKQYYPNIFSVLSFGRDLSVELKVTEMLDLSKSVTDWGDCDDEVNDYEDEIKDIVEKHIYDECDDSFTIKEWNGNFLQLKRTKTSMCPCTRSREHDNRGAYITINIEQGKVYMGCYCNESKCVDIGNYKDVETEEQVISDIVDCEEASLIYTTKSGKSKNDGQTYGYITKHDNKFARWICDNNIHPHTKIFHKVLGIQYNESDDYIKLDNIKPDEIIDQNNIGSYIPRLEKADVVCMRSNMMTFKTQNLKELMGLYKRVLIVSVYQGR
jgi:hypothetical protein